MSYEYSDNRDINKNLRENSKILRLDTMKNMSIDEIVSLYREGYILEYTDDINHMYTLSEIYNLGEYISEKISIIIPVHHTEETVKIDKTLEGIQKTIVADKSAGRLTYTITLIGTLPSDFDLAKFNSLPNTKYIKTDIMLGDAKNLAGYDAIVNYKPDILVFMDSHMNFFSDNNIKNNSNNWGNVIAQYLSDHPNHIVAPAVSLYDKPYQRGFGVFCELEDDDKVYDLKWKWWGSPPSNNEPFEVPGLCGCMMAMSPFTFMDTMGYSPPLAIDDREFNIRAYLLGKTFMSIPNITVGHRFASGYSDFSKPRSTQWGFGHLLLAFLNMDDVSLEKLYRKGIHATADKEEALRMTKSNYWKNMRLALQTRRVRTFQEYFARWRNEPKTLSLSDNGMPICD